MGIGFAGTSGVNLTAALASNQIFFKLASRDERKTFFQVFQ